MTTPPRPYTTATSSGGAATASKRRGFLRGEPLAAWPRRSVATFIDFAVTVYFTQLVPGIGDVLTVMVVLTNSVFLQTRTNQSLGKLVMGIFLVRPVDAPDGTALLARPSYLRCLARIVFHLVDLVTVIGFLRPIRHTNRQTFTDSICHTVVLKNRPIYSVDAPYGSRNVA